MDKHTIANIFYEMASLLGLKGDNPFKIRAYENAARIIEATNEDIKRLADEDRLTEIKGIGANLADHIREILKTGRLIEHENLKKEIPEGVVQMLSIQGLGPKRVHHIWKKLKIKTVGELEMACHRHLLENEEGFGKKTQDNVLSGIESLKKFSEYRLFVEAYESANEVFAQIKKWSGVIRAEIGGSIRRKKEIIRDIDILVSSKKPAAIMDKFVALKEVEKVVQRGETKSAIVLKNGMNCDLRVVEDNAFPFALHYFTGSKEHNIAMRALAKKMGYKLSEYGLFKGEKEKPTPCKSEADLFKTLGLNYIEPELREDMGEIDAAAKDALPKLIELRDLKGVMHCHSTYSDGSETLEEMALAAKKLGFCYIVICDHSQAVTVAHGMKPADVKRQHKEIDELNKKLKGVKLIKGIEVDIMADGSLDYKDDVLASFDIVIASVHSRFNMKEDEMTERILRAISNPHVDILGHPTGRLLLSREPYAVDLRKVIDECARTRTAIEINSHPQRLDLDWRYVRYAKEKGVKLAISPDAHSAEGLKDAIFGVWIARKGWAEKKDILNCLDADALVKTFK